MKNVPDITWQKYSCMIIESQQENTKIESVSINPFCNMIWSAGTVTCYTPFVHKIKSVGNNPRT